MSTSQFDQPGTRRRLQMICNPLLWGIAAVLLCSVPGPSETSAMRQAMQKGVPGYSVTFEVTETSEKSEDQITIIFSNSKVESVQIERNSIFGDDILQEFSFSARDVTANRGKIRFTRSVRDLSFVDASYIRVVNHGTDGWGAGTISMWLNTQPILDKVPMSPTQGGRRLAKLADFNRRTWPSRVFWETQLKPIRRN